jgi:hypothetical protein
VLFRTRALGWGSDTHLYADLQELRRELPVRLARGEVRVLKQHRGQNGEGVWRVKWESDTMVRARHAKSGCSEEIISLEDFFERCKPYFSEAIGSGHMIDQVFQPRLSEGMVRCYLVQGKVEGFGRQEIVALHPVPDGESPETAPKPTKRHYHPAMMPEFQRLKDLVESEWVPEAQRLLEIRTEDLPVLWDCDFMFGPKDASGNDTYVLCEINVSCVSPFPDSAAMPLAKTVMERISR